MDELKKYVEQHRSQLDTDEPGNDMWQRINQEPVVKKEPARIVKLGFRFAAAAALITAIVFASKWVINDNSNTTQPPIIAKQNVPVSSVEKDTTVTVAVIPQKQSVITVKPISKTKQQPSEASLLSDLQNTYGQFVKMELNSIRSTAVYGEAPGNFDEFKTMLNQMDNDEALVRNNIKASGLTSVSLQQLINIYQKKLELLKTLHTEIEKMNNKVKQLPAADSVNSYFITI